MSPSASDEYGAAFVIEMDVVEVDVVMAVPPVDGHEKSCVCCLQF